MKNLALLITFSCCLFVQLSAQNTELWGMTSNGGSDGQGVLFYTDFEGNNQVVQTDFIIEYDGGRPQYTKLLEASDGLFYGLSWAGGEKTVGVLFSYDPVSGDYVKLHEFEQSLGIRPYGSLIQVGMKLYGMTESGGLNGRGVLFEYNLSNSTYTTVFDFSSADGSFPQGDLILATNGNLYGMTRFGGANDFGVIFEYIINTDQYSILKSFDTSDGTRPYGSLLEKGSNVFYGMTGTGGTNGKGTIFKYDLGMSSYDVLYDFPASGASPQGNLITDGMDKLYGLTLNGGANGDGVLFEYDLSAAMNPYTVKHDFINASGSHPHSSLTMASDGMLYGTCSEGGTNNLGVIFKYDPTMDTYSSIVDFSDETGGKPYSCLMQASDGDLYGMTSFHGTGSGSMFKYDINLPEFEVLFLFQRSDGRLPQGRMVQADNGLVYGCTLAGGQTSNLGTIFQINPLEKTRTTVYEFDGSSGTFPTGRLIQAENGMLYGMCTFGGAFNSGDIFEFNPTTKSLTSLHDFALVTGAYPNGGLLQVGTSLFGMTENGGTGGDGVIFEYNIESDMYEVIHHFDEDNDGRPQGSSLIQVGSKLFGVTYNGGAEGIGQIFEYDLDDEMFSILYSFASYTAAYPYGDLVHVDGKLYGTAAAYGSAGINGKGIIFEYDTSGSGTFTNLFDFNGTDGEGPGSGMMMNREGNLYGMTTAGGNHDLGVIYEYDIGSDQYRVTHHFNGTNGTGVTRCDLLEVDLDFCAKTFASIDTTSCFSYEVPSGSMIYYASGTYMDTLENMAGCDSVLTIELTIDSDPVVCGFQPCTENISITPDVLSADPHQSLFQATVNLTAEGIITQSNSENITFQAGNSIELIPEFEVESGAQLLMEVVDCE